MQIYFNVSSKQTSEGLKGLKTTSTFSKTSFFISWTHIDKFLFVKLTAGIFPMICGLMEHFKFLEFIEINSLTHWGWMMHICISELTIIGSDNGLSPGRCQSIVWTNAGILLIGPLGTNFSKILIKMFIFSFKKRIRVRWRRCGCLVTWFCYHLIAKPGNKTVASSWPDPFGNVFRKLADIFVSASMC